MGAIIAINAWNRVGVATGMQPPAIAEEALA
jgi:alkylhydroperoxidase family enzyme